MYSLYEIMKNRVSSCFYTVKTKIYNVIVVVKLFTVDAFQLGTLYRVASFAFIGPVLMGAGFYFQKNRETIKAFLSDKE